MTGRLRIKRSRAGRVDAVGLLAKNGSTVGVGQEQMRHTRMVDTGLDISGELRLLGLDGLNGHVSPRWFAGRPALLHSTGG